MAEKLTTEQKLAVNNRGGNLLVSAAAGSGKTKVLVDRLMSYLTDPVKPESIDRFLIITYTKAAASELRSKIAAKLSERIAEYPENRHLRRQMQRLYLTKIATVHAFCGDILKEYAYMLDFSGDFRVADENECLELQASAMEQVLDQAYRTASHDSDFFTFVDSQGLGRDDRVIPQLVLDVYRRAKCHLNCETWLDRCLRACALDGVTDAAQTIWGKYLIDDLKSYISLQIQALSRCAEAVSEEEFGEKPAALLYDTVAQLQRMLYCKSWDEIYAAKNISYGTLRFPPKFANEELQYQVKVIREACKKGLQKKINRFSGNSAAVLADIRATQPSVRGLIELVRSFEREYSRLKRSRHILDFSDLEHKMLDLLWGKSRSGITGIAKEISGRFCEIMVDEYQDSNAVQDAIFHALTAYRNNCFMVGDVKQSIYQFRLADPGIFLDKYNRYEPVETAEDTVGRKVLLSKNFRSGGEVVEAVNDVFYDSMTEKVGGLCYTQAEALSEGIPRAPLSQPAIELHGICVESDTYDEEAAFVANRVKELLDGNHFVRDGEGERPICPEDIVILMRSPGSVGMRFKFALEQAGISCQFGNGTDLLETEEVQFIQSFLQIISNPLQDIPLIAVLAGRVFGFSADRLAHIRTKQKNVDFYTAVKTSEDPQICRFLRILNKLRQDARVMTLPQLVDEIMLLTDADAVFQSMPDGDLRTENIRSFCTIVSTYASAGSGTLESFLEYLQVIAQEGVRVQTPDSASGAVTIMSIHKSKGLEFPVVFLCGLSKGFNMEHTHAQVLCDGELGLGLSCVDTKLRLRYPTLPKLAIGAKIQSESVSEEMRVLYVAMTRPKDRLIMTYAVKKLEDELAQTVARMMYSEPVLLCSEVNSAGEWVIMSCLRHKEATAFHRIAGKPAHLRSLSHPWLISVEQNLSHSDCVNNADQENFCSSSDVLVPMHTGLSYRYPHMAATQTPSKMTATQLKGRYKDQEIAEGTRQQPHHQFRIPTFAEDQMSATRQGTVLHTVMQYLRFAECTEIASVKKEIDRIAAQGQLTAQEAVRVDPAMIYRFFTTDPGRMLRDGTPCIREFKFSVLDDANQYTPDIDNEQILMQGVVDCALITDTGIIIIDFKSDYVAEGQQERSVDRYRDQVRTYVRALEKIYEMPVIGAYLYYFRSGNLISVL